MNKRKPDSSPPRDGLKRTKSAASAITSAIKSKPDWKEKVMNQKILTKWMNEAAVQGADKNSIDSAFKELRKAAEQDVKNRRSNTLDVGEYEDDEDLQAYGDYEEVGGNLFGVSYADGIVPEELAQSLEKHLDELAALPEKDFHPGSEGMVQDLIHPSLYPYVKGVSAIRQKDGTYGTEEISKRDKKGDLYDEGGNLVAESDELSSSAEEKDKKSEEEDEYNEYMDEYGNEAHFANRHREYERSLQEAEKTAYQWLPAEFSVDELGVVSIDSYINNLDRAKYPELYEDIAAVFGVFLPLFNESGVRTENKKGKRRYQVIVKAANYVISERQQYEGNWHVEGVPSENIIASGIYYYHVDKNINPKACLAFREYRDYGPSRQYSQNLPFNKNLGKVDTPQGRCLTFMNTYQHKVKYVSWYDPDAPDETDEEKQKLNSNQKSKKQERKPKEGPQAVRKILCFFLVNPYVRLPSTAIVPMQQWDIVYPAVLECLAEASKRYLKAELPPEILDLILSYTKWGFTKEEADAHRIKLMNNRKFYIGANNNMWQREYSFCEH